MYRDVKIEWLYSNDFKDKILIVTIDPIPLAGTVFPWGGTPNLS